MTEHENDRQPEVIQTVEHQEQIIAVPSNFHKYRWTGIWLWVCLMTVAVAYGLGQNRSRIHDIQSSRIHLRLEQCRDQNARNLNTKATLDTLTERLPPDRRARARESEKFTLLLIDAIIPLRDCSTVERDLTGK